MDESDLQRDEVAIIKVFVKKKYIYIYKQQCKIKNQLEDHWFASFRSFIDLPQAIYSKSE